MGQSMKPDTLEALRYKASREDTPIEEARNAALAYVRGLGAVEESKEPSFEAAKKALDDLAIERAYTRDLEAENSKLRTVLKTWVGAFALMDEASQIVVRPPPKRLAEPPKPKQERTRTSSDDPYPNVWGRRNPFHF